MIYFEIQADNVKRAADFYTQVFGWSIGEPDKNIPIEYRRIHADNIAGGLLKRPAATPGMGHGTNAFVCSFEIENFDKVAEKIISLGGVVALPKFAVPGKCWQGYFLDTEGNTFGIYQPDSQAQ